METDDEGSAVKIMVEPAAKCEAAAHLIEHVQMSERRAARELAALIGRKSRPGIIASDHGTAVTSHPILAWAKDRQIEWH